MTERPIIFSGEQVRAIKQKRKTQTRRVVKRAYDKFGQSRTDITEFTKNAYSHGFPCPYGVPGNRLWLREKWMDTEENPPWIIYAADSEMRDPSGKMHGHVYPGPWKPSINMPRWASRITLEIVGVRVERLQDISGYDAWEEGVWPPAEPHQLGHPEHTIEKFHESWDAINAKSGFPWSTNPWVWVIEFRRVEGRVDE